MASKVNVRFVAMLGAGLGLVLVGMAAVFFFVLKKSGQDWADRGDAAMAAGNYEEADKAYSFAVAHDRTNVEWLQKWLDAMGHLVIENEINFEDRFTKDYRGALRAVAHIGRTADIGAHERHLTLIADGVGGSSSPDPWRYLLAEARASLVFFEDPTMPPTPGVTQPEPWHRLYRFSGTALTGLYILDQLGSPEELEMAERDLRLALEADPGDAATVAELAQLYAMKSMRRRTQPPVDLAESQRLLDRSRAVYAAHLELKPRDATSAMGLLGMDVDRARAEFTSRRAGAPLTLEQHTEAMAPFVARLDAIGAVLMEEAAQGGLGRLAFRRFGLLEATIAPADRRRRTREILAACIAARPDDLEAMVYEAEVLAESGEAERAVARLQDVIDLPDKPLGPEGWRLFAMRPVARQMQAEVTLNRLDASNTPEDRERILSEAARYRALLAGLVPSESTALLKIDARTAFLRQDWPLAERLLVTLNERTAGADMDVLWWTAITASQLRNLGVAQQMLNTLNERRPDDVRYMLALAALERDLRNMTRAQNLARRLLELAPGDAEVQRLAGLILGGDDPIRAALDRFELTSAGGEGVLADPEGALAGLEQDFRQNNSDRVLGGMLVRQYLVRRDVARAMAVADQVLAVAPDDADFARFRTAMGRGEIVQTMIELVDGGPGTAAQKALLRRMVYLENNMPEQAARELAAAEAAAPDDRDVIEARFTSALSAEDRATVSRIVERARANNIDGMGGDTFVFRQHIMEGRHREAATVLESLLTRTPNDARLWRFLGAERSRLGRFDDAATAYRRALTIRPNDVAAAIELIDVLQAAGRSGDALGVARQGERFGSASLEYMNRLWVLEARNGNRQTALTGREALRRRDPSLAWNNALLSDLYMDLGRWDSARQLLDEMRRENDNLTLVGLDARWHADRGDLDGARRVYMDYIAKLPAERMDARPFLEMAQFMMMREQVLLAAATLESGRVHQSRERMECDRALGDVLGIAQRLPESIAAYQRVVDGGADDDDFTYRKRLADSLIRAERLDEAERHLAAMSARASTDRQLLMLRAEIARTREDRREAARLLDEAVRLFPDDPIVYFKRAELLGSDESRLLDALADYDSAIRKMPSFWQALRNRSGLYRRLGRIGEAVADLRAATVAAGTDGDAVTQLLGELMNLRRMPEAISAADEAAAARPTDVVFLQRLGAVFARRGEFVAAARYYKSAFDLRPEIPIAERYLDALLSQNPPAVRLAEDLINSLGQRVLSSPGLLSGSVAINARRSRLAEAERDATAAFDLVSGSPDGLVVWHRSMSRAFLERDAYMAYLRRLAEAKRATVLRDWPVVFLAIVQVDRPETVQAGMELLNRLANGGEPREVRILALRTIGTTLYGRGEYSQAAQVWEASLRMFPDDWEINNNLAYTLAEHLDRGADAVPYALVAVRGQPQSPSVNDTVGWAYFKAGEPEKALPYLTLAARLSRDASELAATMRHIIEVEIALGHKANAERWLAEFKRLIGESPWLDPSVAQRAAELEDKIGSLP